MSRHENDSTTRTSAGLPIYGKGREYARTGKAAGRGGETRNAVGTRSKKA